MPGQVWSPLLCVGLEADKQRLSATLQRGVNSLLLHMPRCKQSSMGCVYFNNTLFSESSVPFQLSDDEEVFYFNNETQFYLRMGNGIPVETEIYKSASGYVFVTQYRLIYKVSDSENSFHSFCIPLREIAAIGEDHTIDFVYGTFVHSLYLSFGDSQRSVFFSVLQDLLSSFCRLSLPGDDDGDSLPFYSDL